MTVAFSAVISVGELVFPPTVVGMIEASAIRSLPTVRILNLVSTAGRGDRPCGRGRRGGRSLFQYRPPPYTGHRPYDTQVQGGTRPDGISRKQAAPQFCEQAVSSSRQPRLCLSFIRLQGPCYHMADTADHGAIRRFKSASSKFAPVRYVTHTDASGPNLASPDIPPVLEIPQWIGCTGLERTLPSNS